MVLCRFEVEDGPTKSSVDLVYPYSTLKPIRDLLRNRVATGDGNELSDKQWAEDLNESVIESEIELQVLLGHIKTTLYNLENSREGDILYFKKDDMARVDICNIPTFEAELGVVKSEVAVKISNPLNVLGLPEKDENHG